MQKNCSNCGSEFQCGFTDGAASAPETLSCWCAELPRVSPVPVSDQDCLCPDCLGKSIAKLINREAAESH